MSNATWIGRVGFAIGTGRCGTKFISEVAALEAHVSSVHERNPLNETFHRYCKWHDLPVDQEGFLHTKQSEIQQDLHHHAFSFEASAYLSLSVLELYQRFNAKFLLLVRSPERVVNSYLRKGWYAEPAVRSNPDLAIGYQNYCSEFHHFLGRIMPSGASFANWNQMSRVGKLAWFWNTLNARVLEEFQAIPHTHWRLEKLEELSYDRYLNLAQFLGFESALTRSTYDSIAKQRPNAKPNIPTIATWTPTEIREFETEVQPMAEQLGYTYRVSELPIPRSQPLKSAKFLWLKR